MADAKATLSATTSALLAFRGSTNLMKKFWVSSARELFTSREKAITIFTRQQYSLAVLYEERPGCSPPLPSPSAA